MRPECTKRTHTVVAIGGLNETNLDILKGTKIDGIAVVSAIMKSENVQADTQNLCRLVEDIIKGE